jgi:hypothetical protein
MFEIYISSICDLLKTKIDFPQTHVTVTHVLSLSLFGNLVYFSRRLLNYLVD